LNSFLELTNIKNGLKSIYVTFLILILITNISIYVNLPWFRQILASFFLFVLPGLVILNILNLFHINKVKLFALSVPLSISFVMFFGFLVNYIFSKLSITRPLSLLLLAISFNFVLIFLIFYAYIKSKINFQN
jgi:uncharacterized membrane protein